jgi:hypothetical protein
MLCHSHKLTHHKISVLDTRQQYQQHNTTMTSTNRSLLPIRSIVTLVIVLICSAPCYEAFTSPSRVPCVASRCNSLAFVSAKSSSRLRSVEDDTKEETSAAKISLEEKMKGWEATPEEIKASTLGGVVPKPRSDGFDVGLWIMFPFLIVTSLLFFVFPFIKDSIDVSSIGPPPTV